MPEGISIETFRGDYEGLERMAHASWRDEYGQASFPNFYRPGSATRASSLRSLIVQTSPEPSSGKRTAASRP